MIKPYSKSVPKILDAKKREIVGKQILQILKVHCGDIKNKKILDFGCSSGVITNILAMEARDVIGIDIDKNAISRANKNYKNNNLRFKSTKSIKTNFRSNGFDIIIANQIYEFVEDDELLMKEIYRLLKFNGFCFFGARNKYAIIEAQYNIPFLSWIPMNLLGYVGRYRSFWSLKQLVSNFKIHDYTFKILKDPKKYGFFKLEKYRWLVKILPLSHLMPLIPNYIWILEKK